MKIRRRTWLVLLVLVVLATGCGKTSDAEVASVGSAAPSSTSADDPGTAVAAPTSDEQCKTELSTIETAIAAWNTDPANNTQPSTADLVGTILKVAPRYYVISAGVISLTAEGTAIGCMTSYS